MCGRFSLFASEGDLVSTFGLERLEVESLAPRYNIAPSTPSVVIYERFEAAGSGAANPSSPVRKGKLLQWGLVPGWAKDSMRPMVNARAETVTEKPMFRSAAAKRRCIVPANGYFEWQVDQFGKKRPWFLSAGAGDPVVGLAGVYEAWRAPSSEWLLTFAILTRPAPDALGTIHDRSPMIVPSEFIGDWLDPSLTDRAHVDALLAAIPAPRLQPRMVGPRVGNVRNDDAGLIEPVE